MANPIEVNKYIGDLNKLNDEISDTVKQLAGVNSQLADISKNVSSVKGLSDAVKQNKEATQAQNQVDKEREKLVNQIATLEARQNKGLQELTKQKIKQQQSIANANKEIRAEGDAYKQLSLQYNKVSQKAKALSAQYGVNSKQAKAAQKQALSLNKKLKTIDKTVGQTTRNVGNYSSALGQLSPALGSVANGFGSMTKAALRFLATPIGAVIGALVLAFTSLKAALTGTVEGQERLAKITGTFKGILGALKEVLITVGENLIKTFTEPQKALERLSQRAEIAGLIIKKAFTRDSNKKNAIETQIKEAREELVRLQDEAGITRIKLDELGKSIVEGAREQAKIEQERFKLEQRRVAFIVREQQLNTQIAEERRKANDDLLDLNTKLESAIKAEELTIQLAREKNDLKNTEIDLLRREQALTSNNLEDNKELAQLEADVLAIQEQQDNQLRSISRRKTTLLNQTRKQREEESNIENVVISTNERLKERERILQEQVLSEQAEGLKKRLEQNLAYINRLEAEEEASEERKKLMREQFTQAATQLGNVYFDLAQNRRDRELQSIESDYANRLKNENLSAEQREEIEKELARKRAEIDRKQAQSEKNQALFNIAIQTAQNVTKSFGNPVLIALASALGLAQAAVVKSQPLPEIPAFFKGTESAPAGLKWFGDRGRELVDMPSGERLLFNEPTLVNSPGGEKVFTNPQTERMLSKGDSYLMDQYSDRMVVGKLDEIKQVLKSNKSQGLTPAQIRSINYRQQKYMNRLYGRN